MIGPVEMRIMRHFVVIYISSCLSKEAAAIIFGLLTFIGITIWVSQIPKYQACLKNPKIDNDDCLMRFLMRSPPIKEATDLAEVVNETNMECLGKVGMKAIDDIPQVKKKIMPDWICLFAELIDLLEFSVCVLLIAII